MDISKGFSGRYLKHSDLDGEPTTATITEVTFEPVGHGDSTESKYIVHFQDDTKSLVLNSTNANVLMELFGNETGEWEGEVIEIYPDKCSFQGKTVSCVRLRKATANPF